MKANYSSTCQSLCKTRLIFLLCSLWLIVACSPNSNSSQPLSESSNWLLDGFLVLSRPLPSVSSSPQVGSALGFMPLVAAHSGTWLSIDLHEKTLNLMEGDKSINKFFAQGIESLSPGVYPLLHKQRNALWYAPDSYFVQRHLAIPAQGDKARYRRGALGDFVLFISKDVPLHSGPIWTPEIGGIRMEENEISRIYYKLDVGSVIEVK